MLIRKRAAIRTVPAMIAAVILSASTASPAFGYEGEVPATVTVTARGAVLAGVPIPVCGTVLGPSATGVPDITVTFNIASAPAGADDVLSSTTAITPADGVACVQVTLDAVVGSRTIDARAGTAVGSITIVLAAAGLPNTARAAVPDEGPSLPASALVGLLATTGAIWLQQHLARRRRGNS